MLYRAIGLMSGSSLDGLDIAFVEFQEQGGKWSYEILQADCYAYSNEWADRLKQAIHLSAKDYLLLHTAYGHYLGEQVNRFVAVHKLEYKVAVIASHGHTTFHIPGQKMTAQLGDGAAIAASTQLPVVSDLRALDVAFGGQGAPIVPIGEKLLMPGYEYFLNIGGIANVSAKPLPNRTTSVPFVSLRNSKGEGLSETSNKVKSLELSGAAKPPSPIGEGGFEDETYIAFDICPANRVLNMLASDAGKEYDENGDMAATGSVNPTLLEKLNALEYYKQPYPKSLANDFGTDTVYPLIKSACLSIPDALRTYVEHIAHQVRNAISTLENSKLPTTDSSEGVLSDRLLATGGGAFNSFLIERLKKNLEKLNIDVIVPNEKLVNYKEALIMAFIGVLRWRQENNVLSSVTGAARDSIGGALWTGQEA